MMDFFWSLLRPIEWLIAWIMYLWHELFLALGLGQGAGAAWVLSIVFLTATVRLCMVPLFLRQVSASRRMQALQPEMQAIQRKYKGRKDQASREAMSRETMALYQKHNANPASSCLPALVQSPFFFSLYNMLRSMDGISAGTHEGIGPIGREQAAEFQQSTLFGAKMSETLMTPGATVATRAVVIVLIASMSLVMFFQQRQLVQKNMPMATMDDPSVRMQRMMVYFYPVIYIFSGLYIPIGVLMYWLTSNVWTMAQQLFQIRHFPSPGSLAEKARNERIERKARREAESRGEEYVPVAVAAKAKSQGSSGQRAQPKRKPRSKR